MAIQKINYSNKVNLREEEEVAIINKISSSDMNEIKSVVNNNADLMVGSSDSSIRDIVTLSWTEYENLRNVGLLNQNTYYNVDDSGIIASTSTPIGSIVKDPSGGNLGNNWLPTNGSSKSKTEYPALFNKIGYTYGGSGDNFNLPLSISNFNLDVTNGQEAFMGYRRNGKWVYCKRFLVGDIAGGSTITTPTGLVSGAVVPVDLKAFGRNATNAYQSIYRVASQSLSNQYNALCDLTPDVSTIRIMSGTSLPLWEVYVEVYYTKNIDSFTPDYDAIKVSEEAFTEDLRNLDTQLSSSINYTTNETVIGKWVDGKPIYRKVVSQATFPSTLGITGTIEYLIRHDIQIADAQNRWRSIPWLYASGETMGLGAWAGGLYIQSNGTLSWQVGSSLGDVTKVVVILEYTKE